MLPRACSLTCPVNTCHIVPHFPPVCSIIKLMSAKTTAELNARYSFSPLCPEASGPKLENGRLYTSFAELSSLHRPFATTAEFSSTARNHCCAVMVVNLLLQKFSAYCAGNSRSELFSHVHAFVGNGPVLTLRNANRFLQSSGLPGRFVRIPADFSAFKGSPGFYALLLAASPLDWHWVLAVLPADPSAGVSLRHGSTAVSCTAQGKTVLPSPFSDFPSGLPVLTGWDSSHLYLWKPGHGSRLLAVWEFKA